MRHWDCGNVEVRVIAIELVAASLGNEAATQEEDMRRRAGTSGLWTSHKLVSLIRCASTLKQLPWAVFPMFRDWQRESRKERRKEGDSGVPEEASAVLGPQVTQPRG